METLRIHYYIDFTVEEHIQFMIDFTNELQNVNFFVIRMHGQKVFEWCLDHHIITISPFLNPEWFTYIEFYLRFFRTEGYEVVWIDVDYLPFQQNDVDDGYGSN